MEGLQRWVRALPPRRRRAVLAVLAVAWLAVWYAALLGVDAAFDHGRIDWDEPIGPLLVAVLGASLGSWWQRRRMGGADRVRMFERAVRSGQLPEDADPEVWRPLLLREVRLKRRILSWFLIGLAAGYLIVFAVLVLTMDAPAWWLAVGLPLLVAALRLLWWLGRREQAKVDRLLRQLPPSPGG